jgi:hypothetical protein
MGQRTSIYLSDELAAMVKASRLPLAELVRRGLNAGGPVDEATLRRVLDEKLAGLPATTCRAQTSHAASSGASDYESEPYLQDP